MCIHLNNEATTCPVFETKTPNQKNWLESTCFRKDSGIEKTIADFQENRILYYLNTKR